MPSVFLKYKLQGSRSLFTLREWLEAVTVSLSNLLIFSWTTTIPLWFLWGYSRELLGRPIPQESDPFVWKDEVINLVIHGVVVDFWFYWTHVVLHWGMFYGPIHKFHHRFKAPTAVASMYTNPIEFCLGNLLGVSLGPVITNCHRKCLFHSSSHPIVYSTTHIYICKVVLHLK